jgi:hypothetical protein
MIACKAGATLVPFIISLCRIFLWHIFKKYATLVKGIFAECKRKEMRPHEADIHFCCFLFAKGN